MPKPKPNQQLNTNDVIYHALAKKEAKPKYPQMSMEEYEAAIAYDEQHAIDYQPAKKKEFGDE